MGLISFVPLFTKQRSRSKLFTITSVATRGHQDRQVQVTDGAKAGQSDQWSWVCSRSSAERAASVTSSATRWCGIVLRTIRAALSDLYSLHAACWCCSWERRGTQRCSSRISYAIFVYFGQEFQLPQRDRATLHISCSLVSCCTAVWKIAFEIVQSTGRDLGRHSRLSEWRYSILVIIAATSWSKCSR